MKVGITIIAKSDDSIWKNGIMQNCVYFYEVMERCPSVSEVSFLQCGLESDFDEEKKFPLPEYNYEFLNNDTVEKVSKDYQLIVSLGAVPSPQNLKTFKSVKGNKFVQYKGGNEFMNEIESVVYGQYKGWPNITLEIGKYDPIDTDEVWMVPQQEYHNMDYMSIKHKAPARSVPFIWRSKYVDTAAEGLAAGHEGSLDFAKKDFSKGWTWASFEPNMSVLKNAMPLIWTCEHLYRNLEDKSKFKSLMVTNAAGHMDNKSLINTLWPLDIYREKRVTFEGRYSTPYILHKYAHGVISHQWGNSLNYAYLDACHFGIPLVHNAHLCPDLGYYYEEWKLKDAAALMKMVMDIHIKDTGFRDRQRAMLNRYTINNPAMIEQYDLLVRNLFEKNEIDQALKYNTSSNLMS